jgi:hypothetical protein
MELADYRYLAIDPEMLGGLAAEVLAGGSPAP